MTKKIVLIISIAVIIHINLFSQQINFITKDGFLYNLHNPEDGKKPYTFLIYTPNFDLPENPRIIIYENNNSKIVTLGGREGKYGYAGPDEDVILIDIINNFAILANGWSGKCNPLDIKIDQPIDIYYKESKSEIVFGKKEIYEVEQKIETIQPSDIWIFLGNKYIGTKKYWKYVSGFKVNGDVFNTNPNGIPLRGDSRNTYKYKIEVNLQGAY